MKGKTLTVAIAAALLAGTAFGQTHAPWPTDWNNWSDPALWCTVGNPGNAPDTRYDPNGYGAVGYEYRIGKFEVTAGQYTEFLNAVAKTDTYGLYNTRMANPETQYGGCNIQRAGSSGNYAYSVASDWTNRPVNFVSWADAARFCNWLANGQPTGAQALSTTEDGSYCLNGATSDAALQAVARKSNARWALPTEDEWYKAAYYKGGSTHAGYWDYPTGSDTMPSNALVNPDPGNNANYSFTIAPSYWRTPAGEFENSESSYGTFDQGGNVAEWNEAILMSGTRRCVRGGSFASYSYCLPAVDRDYAYPAYEGENVGFRVAYVPEPAMLSLLALGVLPLIRKRRRGPAVLPGLLAAVAAVLLGAGGANADTHAPWPTDWNNWSDPALWCTVGNPGNAGEGSGEAYGGWGPSRICGAVSYEYRIGKFEVTAGQYCTFLNAVGATDTYGLYNTYMDIAIHSTGCNISRAGISGSYTYSVPADWANRPVNFVSWADAARFTNWLHNGRPTGAQDLTTTEDGAYYLNGASMVDSVLVAVTRKPNARYAITSEDEWYKAAYHKNDGVTGNYWDYPMRTDEHPRYAGQGANFNFSGWLIGPPYYRTEVGDFEGSFSPYRTFDQGGNIQEWTEAVDGLNRGRRGGSFAGGFGIMEADYRYPFARPSTEYYDTGFRVSEVPEPATVGLLAIAGLALIRHRRRSGFGAAAVIAASLLLAPAAAHARSLTLSKAVVGYGSAYYKDFAFDASGGAHVVWEDGVVDRIYYNTNAGGGWPVPTYLYPTSDVASTSVSVGVDRSGSTHVAYDSGIGAYDVLTYATNKTGTWTSEVVRTKTPTFSLAIDAADGIHVAYYDGNTHALNYAVNSGAGWSHAIVDSPGAILASIGPELRLDSSGHAHITYYDFQTDAFRYATNASGAWQCESLDTAGAVINPPHLDIGPGDTVAVVYNSHGTLRLAERTAGGWNKTQIASVGTDARRDFDMAVGDDGTIYVAFDEISGTEHVATKRAGSINIYDVYAASDSGYGPIIHAFGNEVGILLWDGPTDEVVFLQGQVPEPCSLGLLLLGSPWLLRRHRSRTHSEQTLRRGRPATLTLLALGVLPLIRKRRCGRAVLPGLCMLAAVAAVLLAAGGAANADTHAPWPTDWNNWSDPALMVTVGKPGNAGEWSGKSYGGYGPDRGCGAVAYTYNIGRYEVTAGQYTAFLNAVAATDTYALYNTYMWSDTYGCKIQRSGSSGSYTYSVTSDWANRPVNRVSWGDAARFANWLHNGQPTGAQNLSTTEDGAYYLNGATTNAQLLAVNREADWKWAITSEDEWYKAAYYNPATSSYYDYPTSSDGTPGNQLINPDPGNNANFFYQSSYTIGSPYWRTEVGEFENSGSPYGTFDQGGNVFEWNEGILYGYDLRSLRGGSAYDYYDFQQAAIRNVAGDPSSEDTNSVGFRVSEVPEPATLSLLGLGVLALRLRSGQALMRRRRN